MRPFILFGMCVVVTTVQLLYSVCVGRADLWIQPLTSDAKQLRSFQGMKHNATNQLDQMLNIVRVPPSRNAADIKRSVRDLAMQVMYVVQQGATRTASTTQYQMLCVAVTLLHRRHNNVTCDYVALPMCKPPVSQFQTSGPRLIRVLKTHCAHDKLLKNLESQWKELWRMKRWNWRGFEASELATWLFTTSPLKGIPTCLHPACADVPLTFRFTKTLPVIYKFTQTLAILKAEGIPHLVAHYGTAFGLSQTETNAMEAYMVPWSILRRCCGTQLSKGFREILWERGFAYPLFTKEHFCDSINVTQVESELVQTQLFREQVGSSMNRGTGPGAPEYTGTYCHAMNTAIAKQKLKMNENPS